MLVAHEKPKSHWFVTLQAVTFTQQHNFHCDNNLTLTQAQQVIISKV